jgi:cytochrome oxidase assembly protein ShyY1
MPRAPAWSWLLVAAAVALFCTLGAWQWRRGAAKEALQATLHDRSATAQILSYALGAPYGLEWRRAQATGRYLPDLQLLLDGQSHRHQPGYQVWTPLVLADASVVVVNRGWVPLDRAGFDGSAPVGVVTVSGFWRGLPEPGVRLEGPGNCAPEVKFPAVVLYPTADELECLFKRPVVGGLLLLDPEAPGGFVREWTDFGFPPQRHYGYAAQWFALGLAAIVIFLVVNRKRPA